MTLFSDILSIPSNPEDFFTLISPIGSGAFGRVYKAIHNETKKIYAIKIIQYFKEDINYRDNNSHIDNINFCYNSFILIKIIINIFFLLFIRLTI